MPPAFPPPVRYTDLDQTMLYDRLVELTASLYPNLDLENRAEIARLFMENQAQVGDILADLIRRKGFGARMVTAQQRSHVVAHAKMLGYRPYGNTAAQAEERFTLAAATAGSVTLPAGTIVRTKEQVDPIRFQILEALVIPAGDTEAFAMVENSETIAEAFVSNGKPYQRFVLTRSPYVDRSLEISTSAGDWTEVDNFLSSRVDDLHFTTLIDSRNRAIVLFGTGRNGLIPTGQIDFAYKIGGGRKGNVPAGAIEVLEGSYTDAFGSSVRISVTNPDDAGGGEERQSAASIQELAPASIRAPISSVAREDYEINARRVPGVARALHLTRNQDAAIQENEGFLWIVPTNGGTAPPALLQAVAAQFGDEVTVADIPAILPRGPYAKTTTFQLRVRPAVYRDFTVFARLHLRTGYLPATVRANVLAALQAFFAIEVDGRTLGAPTAGLVPNPLIDFGFYLKDANGQPTNTLARSDIFNAVRDAAGVLKIGPSPNDFLLNGTSNVDPPLAPREFPRLGPVTLINAANGQPL